MNTLTQQHRAQQLLLRRATQAQVTRLWPGLDYARLDATYPDFAVAAARLVEANRRTSSGLAAGYLREFRRSYGIKGQPKIVLAVPLIVDQFSISLRTTSVAAIKTASGEGTVAELAMRNALVQTSGAMARLVLNAGRETVAQSVAADPAGLGYQRVLGGAGCDWCRMLAGRGAVYSEGTADFEAHDHCGCSAEPIYS